MKVLPGRHSEQKVLQEALTSKEAELVAVYVRRRVGKTFLIRNFFKNRLIFEFSGVHDASLKDQLANFSNAINEVMKLRFRLLFRKRGARHSRC